MKVAIYCRLSSEERDKLAANDDGASAQSVAPATEDRNIAENQIAEIDTTLNLTADKKILIAKYKGRKTLTKEMVTVLIDSIEVGKRDPVAKTKPVVIH